MKVTSHMIINIKCNFITCLEWAKPAQLRNQVFNLQFDHQSYYNL